MKSQENHLSNKINNIHTHINEYIHHKIESYSNINKFMTSNDIYNQSNEILKSSDNLLDIMTIESSKPIHDEYKKSMKTNIDFVKLMNSDLHVFSKQSSVMSYKPSKSYNIDLNHKNSGLKSRIVTIRDEINESIKPNIMIDSIESSAKYSNDVISSQLTALSNETQTSSHSKANRVLLKSNIQNIQSLNSDMAQLLNSPKLKSFK